MSSREALEFLSEFFVENTLGLIGLIGIVIYIIHLTTDKPHPKLERVLRLEKELEELR